MKIGFTGLPSRMILKEYKDNFPHAEWIDLDVPLKVVDKKRSCLYIPETTCSIIQTILANSEYLKPDVIIASVGECKCDSMRFLIPVIKRLCPKTKIIECSNNDTIDHGCPISGSDLELIDKFELITANVTDTSSLGNYTQSKARAGFWGVPPYDYSLLKLFPKQTHILGWTRCMENKTPNNPKLEYYVPEGLPTVFFSQSFCPKNIMAKELAHINKGLYLEIDGFMDKSSKAKVNAFLELKNCY
jgi:hypothetical protein